MAKVVIDEDAQAQLEYLPLRIQARVEDIIDRLEQWPQVSGAKPLRGKLKGYFRIRTGDYRVVFTVEGKTVVITQMGHRRDIYEG